ncbi:hypothetical protein [Simiduia aestuariiviva]|uniref:Uncharacterized protein n=1 Tax=Simiduia aestuariiviva TaxID=1510459 RepID=A0A839USI4_9GAMM|nr:hypothetical protein [Simiduia aestuariiviva]MBB3169409.1 hypothetical protein [Simiduia aestuariiviva]
MKAVWQVMLLFCTAVALSINSVAQEDDSNTVVEQSPPPEDVPLNLDRLWLPTSYTKYWANLRQIAELALASERCIEVVRGELARAESAEDAPVFAIVCRDAARKTYVNKFDGLSIDSFDQAVVRDLVVIDYAGEEVAVVDVTPALYEKCVSKWHSQLELMRGLTWLDDLDSVEPVMMTERDSGEILYRFARKFNAQNVAGVTLRYVAICEGTSLSDVETHIDIRPPS